MQDVRKSLITHIARNSSKKGPISTTQILKKFPELSNQNLNHHLNFLHAQGKIKKSDYFGSNGARMWYIASSKQGDTLIFDTDSDSISWDVLVSRIPKYSPTNSFYKRLGFIMQNFLQVIKEPDREKKENILISAREELNQLIAMSNSFNALIKVMADDPSLWDVDILSSLKLSNWEEEEN